MKKNHLFSIITAGMLTITLLAGCGNTGSNANADTGSNTNTVQESTEDQASAVPESEAQTTGEGQNGETVTVTDVRGEVEIPADPQRIVDLSGNSDILSILGYSVVGTANSDAYDYTKFPTYLEDTLQGAEILGIRTYYDRECGERATCRRRGQLSEQYGSKHQGCRNRCYPYQRS